jgi:hypothetical protein
VDGVERCLGLDPRIIPRQTLGRPVSVSIVAIGLSTEASPESAVWAAATARPVGMSGPAGGHLVEVAAPAKRGRGRAVAAGDRERKAHRRG